MSIHCIIALKNLNMLHDSQIRFVNYWHHVIINESNYLKKDLWNISKMPFQPNTVIFCAIQLAVYMGVQNIYLLGCDHDYLLDLKGLQEFIFIRRKMELMIIKILNYMTRSIFLMNIIHVGKVIA